MRNDDKNKTDAAAVAAAAEDRKTTKKKMVGVTTTATTKTTGCGGGGTSHSTRSTTSVKTVNDYLPPLPLVMTIIACSGFTFLYAFRDVFATGRVIGGAVDDAFLTFTNSHGFFDDANGWKSTQGGLSSIQQITTDDNNMGGLFVRKIGGAASLTVQLTKIWPFLIHPTEALWSRGHFRPLLWGAVLSDLSTVGFYATYLKDLEDAGAGKLPLYFMAALAVECLVIFLYLVKSSRATRVRGPAVAMPHGKSPSSVVSRIVSRTTLIVSGAIAVVAGRDLFFPGTIMKYIPRDDIYLEWTGALIHSPREGTPEAVDHGMEVMLHIGDKFVSQAMALNMLLVCLFKAVSAFVVRYGSDGSGSVKAQMIWMPLSVGCGLTLYVFRLFASAARSASLDLRWHLMMMAYETLILGIYGWL